jgi:6-phosphogluconolactonase
VVLADEAAVAREAAARLVAALGAAIGDRGEGHVALTGGSTAVSLYRELVQAEWRAALDWERVHLWWGDERFVPVDHPDSNIGLTYNILLELSAHSGESGTGGAGVDAEAGDIPELHILPENVHPYEIDESLGESEPAQLTADRYAAELERYLPSVGGLPAFDVMMLGVGSDGHILSIFPGSKVLDTSALVVVVPAPRHIEPHHQRVSLHPRLLRVARLVIVMVAGDGKADVIGDIFGKRHDPARWPAQLALLPNAVWLLDKSAASKLT